MTVGAWAVASAAAHGQISPRRPVIAPNALPAANCPPPRDSVYDATVAVSTIRRNARTAVVSVCLGIAPRLAGVARYAGTLNFSTSLAAFDSATHPSGGARDVDASRPGVISFAGARPSGLTAGALLTVRLRLLRPGVMPPVTLKITELQTTTGASAIQQLWVQDRAPIRVQARRPGGVPLDVPTTTPADSAPRISAIDRQTVTAAIVETGQMINVTIGGANFDRTNNTVMFGPVPITDLPAELGVLIRFAIPATYPTTGGASPMKVGAGDFPITVRNSHGTSNAVVFHITP